MGLVNSIGGVQVDLARFPASAGTKIAIAGYEYTPPISDAADRMTFFRFTTLKSKFSQFDYSEIRFTTLKSTFFHFHSFEIHFPPLKSPLIVYPPYSVYEAQFRTKRQLFGN